ncbi:glycosyltransferase family 2 protein [Candidatus Pelagibacter sp.]|uniref:glycosyltransferase family 2 protein n=1 Tax=Candidatus Pelagibacter sp. TaxID=2024849 RepID=UPI003F874612
MKKFFIKICKFFGYEILDQNNFSSPTMGKELNEELSILNEKSIVLPLGEVKITKKVKSILIILRMNTDIQIWDQNRKRLFEYPKIEYTKRSINSLIKSINFLKSKHSNINVKTIIVDDNSSIGNLNIIKKLIDGNNIEIINLDILKYQNIISKQKNKETFANLASLLQSFEIGKNTGKDLIYFIEDDYLHFETMLEEMVSSYERIASQINKDIFMCPSDYPYLYMDNTKTNVLIGNKRHWRTIDKTLCTFLTTKNLLDRYWDNFYKNCLERHDPFEKYLNEIYSKEICISPLKSLSLHLTNINSSYGLSPFIDYKKLWEENKIND